MNSESFIPLTQNKEKPSSFTSVSEASLMGWTAQSHHLAQGLRVPNEASWAHLGRLPLTSCLALPLGG